MKGCPKCGQRFNGDEEFCPQDGETLVALDDQDIDSSSRDPLIGTTLDDRYAIQNLLGEGGMGIVYLATHAVIGKRCAVKVLRPDIANEHDVSERFIQEARSAAAIGNEHVIEITDFGKTPDGAPYFVMEFLEGASLHDVLKETPKLDIERALHIIDQCCEALAKAHDVGVIHRDLKPENLFLITRGTDSDYVKVLDFGIAKVARETGRLTRTGTIFGTPQYMSPEQAAGTSMDERTDIYSLGIIMYEMLCGRVPFEADTFMGVLTKHLYEEPIPPSRRSPPVDLPEAVESVILKSIAKKRDRRYRTMTDFQKDIRTVLKGGTPESLLDQKRESTLPPSPSQIVGDSRPPAYQSAAPQKRPAGKVPFIIGAVIIITGALVGAYFLLKPSDKTADPSTVVGALTPKLPVQVTDTVEEEKTALVEAEKTPSVDNKVTISSTPPGAKLLQGGVVIGNLPQSVARPPESSPAVVYQLKQDHYQDHELVVTSSGPEALVVTLKPLEEQAAEGERRSDRKKKRKKKRKSSSELKEPREPRRARGDIVNPWD